jgi:hypothetical protein
VLRPHRHADCDTNGDTNQQSDAPVAQCGAKQESERDPDREPSREIVTVATVEVQVCHEFILLAG